MQVAKNDSVIRATAPSGCSPVRLVPAVGVTTGAHYRMSTDILHPHKLQICGVPERSNRTAKPIVRPKGDKNSLPRSGKNVPLRSLTSKQSKLQTEFYLQQHKQHNLTTVLFSRSLISFHRSYVRRSLSNIINVLHTRNNTASGRGK